MEAKMDAQIVKYSFIGLAISLLFGMLVVIYLIFKFHRNPTSRFNFEDLLLVDDRASVGKIGQLIALNVSTWGFIVLVAQGKLTEWYFTAYMGMWAGAQLISKAIDLNQKPSNTTVSTSTTSTVIKADVGKEP